jgi:hypothetical protein
MIGRMLLAAALLASQAQSTHARPKPAHPQAQTGPCELHIWPSGSFRLAVGSSRPWTQGRDPRVHTNSEMTAITPPDALAPEAQLATLGRMEPEKLFGMPGASVVMHPEPLSHAEAASRTTRHSASRSDCYGELILNDLFLENVPLVGRGVRMMATFLRFEGPGSQVRVQLTTIAHGAMPVSGLHRIETVDELNSLITQALRESILHFAGYVQRAKPAAPAP